MQKISPLRSSDSGLGAAWILRRYGGAMVRPTLAPFHHAKEKVIDNLFQELADCKKGLQYYLALTHFAQCQQEGAITLRFWPICGGVMRGHTK